MKAAVVVFAAITLLTVPAVASDDLPDPDEWSTIAESGGCGLPRFFPPRTGLSGGLGSGVYVRGPFGGLFGRTIGQVESQLVKWTIPMSNGVQVRVHRRILPALRKVEANLAQAAAEGLRYRVRSSDTHGWTPRTSVAHDGISFHAMGVAIDINATTNPYRLDNRLISDMPEWWIAAWEDAGMCWGGHWNSVKDPMHFSWTGPGGVPGQRLPEPFVPLTLAASPTTVTGTHGVIFGEGIGPRILTDLSGDGAPDVVHLRPWADGDLVVEMANARRDFQACSVRRWYVDDPPTTEPALAHMSGHAQPDLVHVVKDGSTLSLVVETSDSNFTERLTHATAVPNSGDIVVFGDGDGDGYDDLWLVGADSFSVYSFSSDFETVIASGSLPDVGEGVSFITGDRTVDGLDELWVVDGSTITVLGTDGATSTMTGPELAAGTPMAAVDYDGDGRPDLATLDETGDLIVYGGNSPLAGTVPERWFLPHDVECDADTRPYHHEGRFFDDDFSEFQSDIEWIAGAGITRGCNPPFEDAYCPHEQVTRGQMAAFMVRALGLPSGGSSFDDTADSEFSNDIAALADAGITRGCNPPANDRFCPLEPVTRGQMAAFLARALDLPVSSGTFVDTVGSEFADEIGALAAVGITRGCNPPENTRFCPDEPVTRAQMAAFLHRALG